MEFPTTLLQNIANLIGATQIQHYDVIQPLWGGYGSLIRAHVLGYPSSSVIVKYIDFPAIPTHPKGWNTPLSHKRKITSYQVEAHWYEQLAVQCHAQSGCHVPQLLGIKREQNTLILVLEDLNEYGLSQTYPSQDPASFTYPISAKKITLTLNWFAQFHAKHMHTENAELWPIGGYWHVKTRLNELAAMKDTALKNAADHLHTTLENTEFKTLIHGDAKIANFCFSEDEDNVAAVDFQYVGAGCGIKDIFLFLTSVIPAAQCEAEISHYLDVYFNQLKAALQEQLSETNITALESEWRSLYDYACADYVRFLKGWSPNNWKINAYTQGITTAILSKLE